MTLRLKSIKIIIIFWKMNFITDYDEAWKYKTAHLKKWCEIKQHPLRLFFHVDIRTAKSLLSL